MICISQTEGYFKIKEIKVIIKRCPSETIAVIPGLEIYGEGKNDVDAINDLKIELIEFHKVIKRIPDNELGKHFKLWKKRLNTLFYG